tara:strand:+ start:1726 stop:2715 length:990 start_codon:yes stop_codon:yes gene_type:complete
MIIKYYETNKINFGKNKFLLFYGKNEGYKTEIIRKLIKSEQNVLTYEEKDIVENSNNFIESLVSKSLFENEKIVIIKRATDKTLKIIESVNSKSINDLNIIINADNLEKKSKLRSYFERHKEFVCVAFYPDNEQTLSKLSYNFVKEKKITISSSNLNLIIGKCNGDRDKLRNELIKIENYCKNGKKITSESISKLSNLNENHDVSELINSCLIKNKKRVIHILNENNFSNEDCILITRTFLNKSKKILILLNDYKLNKNIELTLSSSKPPIFWKDKEITKQQIYKWTPEDIKNLIYKLNELELLIKKNINHSINIVTDFLLSQVSAKFQ